MVFNLVIDALVRESMVMVARLSTAKGVRAPLTHLANQVFLDLLDELRAQGVSHKVIADMFGMTLRAYHAKVRRLESNEEVRHRTLWQAVAEFIAAKQTVARADVLQRFRNDDPVVLGSVLNDLVRSSLVERTGSNEAIVYQFAPEDRFAKIDIHDLEAIVPIVWVKVHRHGPITRSALKHYFVSLSEACLDEALRILLSDGRVQIEHKSEQADDGARYKSSTCIIAPDATAGREGAMIDHFNAVINTICSSAESEQASEKRGKGSTYHFDITADHPMYLEVTGLFDRFRAEATRLREKLDAHGAVESCNGQQRLTIYAGQYSLDDNAET